MSRRARPSGRTMATLTDNFIRSAEIAAASHDVIGARMALGLEASHSPTPAHLTEAMLMTSEKMSALSQAAFDSAPSTLRMGQTLAAATLAEASAALSAGARMACAATPAAAAAASAGYAVAATERLWSVWASIAGAAVGGHAAALAPVHRTATANARRLKG